MLRPKECLWKGSMSESNDVSTSKQQIRELQDAYSLAMDSGKYEYFEKIFLPDIEADYGPAGIGTGLDSLKDICRSALEPLDSVQHMNGNHWARINGPEAEAGCYFRVHMTREGVSGGTQFEMGGKYTDQLIRTHDGWRIATRKITLLWSSGNPEVRFPSR